jgi:hypothetical protein
MRLRAAFHDAVIGAARPGATGAGAVTAQHLRGGPAVQLHQVPLGPAAVQPGVAEVMPEPVRPGIHPALPAAAGEDIRWVPRRLVSSVALPGNDFYLFDDRLAVFLLYAGNGLAVDKLSSARLTLLTCGCAGLRLRPFGSLRYRIVSTSPSSSAKRTAAVHQRRLRSS